MAITSKYFITNAELDTFIDFNLPYGNLTLNGQEMKVIGSSNEEMIFVRPGMTVDFTASSGGVDKIYLEGIFAQYSISISAGVATLTGGGATVTVSKGASEAASDRLVFANGTVNSWHLFEGGSITLDPVETSLFPADPATPGSNLDADVKAIALDSSGETFALVRPGINYTVTGSAGVDSVYVSRGATVDTRGLRGSRDDIYFTGRWEDYSKTVGNGDLTFTRAVDGHTETVRVSAGTGSNNDRLIFANGSVLSNEAKGKLTTNPNAPITEVPNYSTDPATPTSAAPTIDPIGGLDHIISVAELGNAITGTSTPYATIALTLGKVGGAPNAADNVRTVTAGADGRWTYTLTPADITAMGQGDETVKAVATDANGNLSPTATQNISIDTIAPTPPTSAPASYVDNVGSIKSPTSTALTTDDQTPGLNIGTTHPEGLTPVLYVNGQVVASNYDNGVLTPTVPLAESTTPYTLGYGYKDAAGNISASSPTRDLTVDQTAPTPPANAPTSYVDNVARITSDTSTADVTNDATPGLNIGTNHPADVTPVLYVDGQVVASTYDPDTGRLTPTDNLVESTTPHELGYGYKDAAGNVSASSPTLSLTVDTSAPTAPISAPLSYDDNVGIITSPTSKADFTDDRQPGINIGALPAGVVNAVLYVDGIEVPATYNPDTGTLTPTGDLAVDTEHALTYAYVDAAGNTSDPSQALTLTVDTTGPNNITGVNVTGITDDTGEADFTTSDTSLTVSGTYTGTHAAGDLIQVSSNGGTSWHDATVTPGTSGGTWSVDDPATRTSGTFAYTVRVIDRAGNLGTAADSQNVTIQEVLSQGSSLDGVTNLDVTSNLVLTFGENVNAVAGKTITIVNDGGTGFHGENTAHNQVILVDSTMVNIIDNRVIINPGFDLDLGNNYHIEVQAGAFRGSSTGLLNAAITDATTLNFTTVTPGSTAIANAAVSQMMQADGTLVAGRSWLDLEGIGNPSQANATPLDVTGGDYALVFKDYDIRGGSSTDYYDGIGVGNANVRLNGFNGNDLLYIDDQGNDLTRANLLNQSSFDGNGSTATPINIRFDGTDSNGPGDSGEGAFVEVVFATGISPIPGNDINLETMRQALGLDIPTYPVISA